jgi:hypothetical protein
MKLCARGIVTMAVAFSLAPRLLLHAESTSNPSDGEMNRPVESRVEPSVAAQSKVATPVPRSGLRHRNTPKTDLFLGYSHFRAVPTLSPGNRVVGLNGGSASITFNLNRYLGLVADLGCYRATELRLTGPGAAPARVADASGMAYTYLSGPRLSYRTDNRIIPFAQILFGGVRASEVILSACSGSLCAPLPAQNAFAITAGGGFDIKVFRQVSLRAIQAEYMMSRFADPATGVNKSQNDLRLSSGLVFRFGGSALRSTDPPH